MQAIGLIETKGLLLAIEAADAMLKAAQVTLLERTFVGGGLVTIIVTGDVGSVKASIEAGVAAVNRINDKMLISNHVIPRPHEETNRIIKNGENLEENNIEIVEDLAVNVKSKSDDNLITNKNLATEIKVDKLIEVEEETSKIVNLLTFSESDNQVEEITLEIKNDEITLDESNLFTKERLHKISKFDVDQLFANGDSEAAIKILNGLKVVKLRSLVRKYSDFGIVGREVSRADKELLINELKKYYTSPKQEEKLNQEGEEINE